MATLNLASLLLLICCIASAIEAHSVPLVEAPTGDREAKNLLYVPYRPILRHAYVPETRYGLGSRQTNSPINPSIAQNGLGPFFGYFPNLLTQPCPAAEKCAECPIPTTTEMTPTAAPVSCQSFEKVTKACPAVLYKNVVGTNGTIDLNIPAKPGTILDCAIKLITVFDETGKIQFTCANKPAQTNVVFLTTNMNPLPADGRPLQGTLYTSPASELELSINNVLDDKKDLVLGCTWNSIK